MIVFIVINSFLNAVTLVVILVILAEVKKVKKRKADTYDLLVVISEWVEFVKRQHESNVKLSAETAVKAEEIKQATTAVQTAVEKVPDQVVERMGGPPSNPPADPWKK